MRVYFKIGSGEVKPSIKRDVDYCANIDEDADFYYVTDLILGLSGIIDKNTVEGNKLESMIKHGDNYDTFLDELAIRNISHSVLWQRVHDFYLEAVEEGKRLKTEEIKKCLNIIYC